MIALCPVIGYRKLSMHETYTVVAIVQLFLIDELVYFLVSLRMVVLLFSTLNRLQHIYSLPERNENGITDHEEERFSSYRIGLEECEDEPREILLNVQDCAFAWESEEQKLLENVTFTVRAGELVGVVGKIGSGKTSLLCSLLGETVS